MKAVQLHGYGGPDQLRYEDVPEPRPASGEVLVKVLATSVNPEDYKLRSGKLKHTMPPQFPVLLGRDMAGEVVETGDGVANLQTGDRVMGLVNHSYAEFLTARADTLTLIPDGLDIEQAAVIPLATLAGAQLIELGIGPARCQTILVTGAVGSVGRTAVFVAKQHGARVIAGVRGTQKQKAQSICADMMIALDDSDEVAAMPDIDAIADTIGGEILGKLFRHVRNSGVLASVLGRSESAEQAGIRVREVSAHPDAERLGRLAIDVRNGDLKIPVAARFALKDIGKAHQWAEKGGWNGKILIVP